MPGGAGSCRAQRGAWTVLHGRALPIPHVPHSRALEQLLQVLHLAAQLLGRREVLAHFHEQSCNLVAAQKASRPPPQPMQDAGLHSRCRDTTISQAGPALPKLPCTQLSTLVVQRAAGPRITKFVKAS